jgi:hypothetical protein
MPQIQLQYHVYAVPRQLTRRRPPIASARRRIAACADRPLGLIRRETRCQDCAREPAIRTCSNEILAAAYVSGSVIHTASPLRKPRPCQPRLPSWFLQAENETRSETSKILGLEKFLLSRASPWPLIHPPPSGLCRHMSRFGRRQSPRPLATPESLSRTSNQSLQY